MIRKMIICCLLFSLNAAAQEQETTDSLSTQETKTSLMTRLHQLQEYLDTKMPQGQVIGIIMPVTCPLASRKRGDFEGI